MHTKKTKQLKINLQKPILFLIAILIITISGLPSKAKEEQNLSITRLGHGGLHIISPGGRSIVVDPWLKGNNELPEKYNNINTFKKIDMILYTHGHVDHFMKPDLENLIKKYNPKIVAAWELCFLIGDLIPKADLQVFTLGNKGSFADFDGIKIAMVHAEHSGGAQISGFEGVNRYAGEAIGYIIEFENGFVTYIAGDTAMFGDMKTIIHDYYKPDLAILPIGGVFTMGPKEAAYATAKLIMPSYVIPSHFKTFPVLEQTANSFVKYLKEYDPKIKAYPIEPGEAAIF